MKTDVGIGILTVVTTVMRSFGLSRRVDWLVEAKVSQKLAVSIFRAKVTI
jgi:hypothetical protein